METKILIFTLDIHTNEEKINQTIKDNESLGYTVVNTVIGQGNTFSKYTQYNQLILTLQKSK